MHVAVDDLRQQWAAQLSPEQTVQLQAFFKAPELYTDRADLTVMAATDSATGRRRLVLPPESVRSLEEELCARLPVPSRLEVRFETGYCEAEPLQLPDAAAYYKAVNGISKANRAAKKQSKQEEARQLLEAARQLVARCGVVGSRPVAFVAVDYEWWEQDQDSILEVGWSWWDTVTRCHRSRHWQVKDNLKETRL